MSKKLTGKEKQSARRMKAKQVASRNRQKTKYLKESKNIDAFRQDRHGM